jgi:Zn-dependent protease with chaperone function
MSGGLGTVYLACLAGLLFGLLAAGSTALFYPWVNRRLSAVHPAVRASWLMALAATPLGSAALFTLLCFLPSLLGAVGLMADHCLSHDDHHAHLCLSHPPAAVGGLLGALLLGLAGVHGHFALWSQARTWLAGRRLLRLLPLASTQGPAADVRLLAAQAPLSLSAGIFRPAVYVSSGLLAVTSPRVLSVILEHERAHVRRRDGLRKLLASLLGAAHFPATRRLLLADLSLACEQACDAEAAERAGDGLEVAEAIVAMERVLTAGPALGVYTSAFGGSNVAARVEALLDPPSDRPRLKGAWLVAGAVGMLAAAEPLHHGIETLVGLLAR